VHTGSIPVSTSKFFPSAISSAGERFPDTEEVTGSIPVSRTRVKQAICCYLGWSCNKRATAWPRPREVASHDDHPFSPTELVGT
jgi:hypothetical protein